MTIREHNHENAERIRDRMRRTRVRHWQRRHDRWMRGPQTTLRILDEVQTWNWEGVEPWETG